MLRAVRFAAELDFQIEPEAFAAVKAGASKIRLISAERIRDELALVSEMVDCLAQGQAPPFGGLHDVRLTVRRAAIGAQLTIEQLLEVADTLTCTGNVYRYRMRLDERHQRLAALLASVQALISSRIGPDICRANAAPADVNESRPPRRSNSLTPIRPSRRPAW